MSYLKYNGTEGQSPNLRDLASKESSFLHLPSRLFLAHGHGDLSPHGHSPARRGSKRSSHKLLAIPVWSAEVLTDQVEGGWEWESSLPTSRATGTHRGSGGNVQEGTWWEGTGGFCEGVLVLAVIRQRWGCGDALLCTHLHRCTACLLNVLKL